MILLEASGALVQRRAYMIPGFVTNMGFPRCLSVSMAFSVSSLPSAVITVGEYLLSPSNPNTTKDPLDRVEITDYVKKEKAFVFKARIGVTNGSQGIIQYNICCADLLCFHSDKNNRM